MNGILKIVLSLSLSGSLLILVLFLCKPLIRERISKRWQYYIWLVVIARLLLPFTPEMSFVGTLFQEIDRAIVQITTVSAPEQNIAPIPQSGDGTVTDSVVTLQGQELSTTAVPSAQKILATILQHLWLIWLIVALILLMRKITIYQGFVRYIKAGRSEVSDIALLDRLAQIGEQVGVKRAVEIYTNGLISSPLLLGFFRPCIVLPTANLPNTDFQYTMLHELTHYKRWDMFYKWLLQVTICLHWFNPLIYLMECEVNRACELACDEAVIKKLDTKERRAYGNTLLNAIGAGGSYKDTLASVTLNESKELLKERLDAIMKYKQVTKSVVILTVLCTILFCVGATAAGAYAAPAANTPVTPWKAMGDSTGQPYTYTQMSYYEAPYIFEMGWNLNEKGYNAYPDKAKITLSNQTKITVSFDGSCKDFAYNEKVLSSLESLLEKLKSQSADSSLPLEKPLIVSVKDIGNSDIKKLAEEYYTNLTITSFVAIFPSLDIDTQKAYCNKMFEDSQSAFFSATLRVMDTDTINVYANKAYTENKLTFFANIVPYLTDEAKKTWIVKSSRDKRNTFLALLTK